tara:strand:+ start:84 stop:353 length:270 start_codon:yes stop_codon:yes gene_type:complete
MIIWSRLPKIDLTIAAAISLETAGFIGNKYAYFYGFAYMFIIVFFFIILISLETVKNKKIVDDRILKNNIRPIESENKTITKQWFWQKA